MASPEPLLRSLPKAELHLHLEGSIRPATAVELAARHAVRLTEAEVGEKYRFADFAGFLEAYKWVTSFLRAPADYALLIERLAEELIPQNVLYAEVTLSAGVMLWRGQDVEANLAAIQDAGETARRRGLRLQWIPDATRQFGPAEAMRIARHAARAKGAGVVAFGMGGDELSIPAERFREAYEYAGGEGLHRVAHAGEIGGPEEIRAAIDLLGAERIGHGIAAAQDADLLATLAERRIPLEVCPTSNLRTGALAKQLGGSTARIEDHPLRWLAAAGVPVVLSTDDPAMFHTSLDEEYELGSHLGFSAAEMAAIAENSFEHAFLPPEEKAELLAIFRNKRKELGLV